MGSNERMAAGERREERREDRRRERASQDALRAGRHIARMLQNAGTPEIMYPGSI